MHYVQCRMFFFVITVVITKLRYMERRTEKEWTALYDSVVSAIIGGRCANSYFGDYCIDTIISEAVSGAGRLIKELKEQEETEQL